MDSTRAVYAFTNTVTFAGVMIGSAWLMNKIFGRSCAPKFQCYWNSDADRGGHTGIFGMHRFMLMWFGGIIIVLFTLMYRIQNTPVSFLNSVTNILS